ncbi:MAG TPA: amidohydrolase [Bacteroidales bacterium]|nr:amidohydrolase [Bacteroidales bacterium]HPK30529.1 amidohydrolase [Bacteroidales bacterium]
MKTALVQHNIVWAEPEINCNNISRLLENFPQVDLIVLPEMFSTGFATKPEGIAENEPSYSLEWMKKSAAKMDCAIAGSVALKTEGGYINRFYFVKPDGDVITYDKRHLFTYGGEHLTFKPGNQRVIIEWRGVRILPIICYDLRFPVWSRYRGDYDMIICVASWSIPRRYHWDTLIRARAIENQCYMAAVNRIGTDPSCEYDGGTVFIDPYGYPVAACSDNKEEVIICETDLKLLKKYRKRFPALRDRDDFSILL